MKRTCCRANTHDGPFAALNGIACENPDFDDDAGAVKHSRLLDESALCAAPADWS